MTKEDEVKLEMAIFSFADTITVINEGRFKEEAPGAYFAFGKAARLLYDEIGALIEAAYEKGRTDGHNNLMVLKQEEIATQLAATYDRGYQDCAANIRAMEDENAKVIHSGEVPF